MYEQYFGLKRTPFRLAPEPDMCFSGKGYVDTLTCLTNALQDYQGIIILSGFPGTGKTAMVRKVAEAAIFSGTTICRINRANITDVEKTLEAELNNRCKLFEHDQTIELSVAQILLASAEQDKHILIIIDDAQRLSTEDINFLIGLVSENRLVMSFLKIILVGHETLDEFFNFSDLSKQHQLTFVHCELTPLERHEIKPYVMHRLDKSGWRGKPSFDDAIYGFVYQATKGIPLRVNSFFDRLLLFVYLEGKEIVDYSILKKFSEELLGEIQLEKSLDVDVSDLQQALNRDDDKPNAAQTHDKKTSLEKKVVAIAAEPKPLLESVDNGIVIRDSRFSPVKKWLAVLVSLILVLILVSFVFSKNSDQQARLPTDNNVLLSENLKQEIKQPVSTVKQPQSVAIAEKALDKPHDTIVSSAFVESTAKLSESATLGRLLSEEPVFDEDGVVGQRPPVTSNHAGQTIIDDSLSMNQTDEPEKTEEVMNDIAATHLDSHTSFDIDTPNSSQTTTIPRKTHSSRVSSEIELAKRNDLEFMMIKRSVDRKSSDQMVAPIEEVPILEGEEIVAPTDEDLTKLITFLTRLYKAGEIDEFSDLFVANAVSNGSFNRKQIRDDYENLFNSTDKRRIVINNLIWTSNGLDVLGIGTFEVFIFKKNDHEMERFHGEIVIEVQKQQTKTQIKKMFYRYNVAS